jgi:hypothetical protein
VTLVGFELVDQLGDIDHYGIGLQGLFWVDGSSCVIAIIIFYY